MADGYLNFDTKIDEGGFNSGVSTLGGIAKKGMAVLTAAVAGAVTGIAVLTKSAISAYADYEQLVGGVETLFGKSAKTVEQYAANAYKTAGLSANDYMETVTSFSASLLQSLGGDTEKAAQMADMAITDMSDNANKMGTDMSRIQDAYQGFAKQNFTMLDNLKLGYGGTQTEMQRLLDDATKLSGVEYDISSYADIVEAIHVVQTEMGITGTTAKEASETISGSIMMMKASWTNLLVGAADTNADFEKLMDEFVNSTMTVADNLIPVIAHTVPAIIDGIVKLLPAMFEAGGSIISNLMSGIRNNSGQLIESALNIVQMLCEGLLVALPKILRTGMSMMLGLIEGLTKMLPGLIPVAVECIVELINSLLDNIGMIIDAGIELLMALAFGIGQAIPVLVAAAPEIIGKLIIAIIENIPRLIKLGPQIMMALGRGILSGIGNLLTPAKHTIQRVINQFKNVNWASVGVGIIRGIASGIANTGNLLISAAKSAAKKALKALKSFLGINSPSKVYRDEVGRYMAQGVGVGFEENMPEDEMNNVVEKSVRKLQVVASTEGRDVSIPQYDQPAGGLPQGSGDTIINQVVNINQPVESPVETARAIRKNARIELAGGVA